MRKKYKKETLIFENITIADAGAEGKAVARVDNMVIFVPFVVPGDVIDLQVVSRRKHFMEAKAIRIHSFSSKRTEIKCSHFGVCGGCKWQNMQYAEQLKYKQKQVEDNLQRIGKIDTSHILPIIPSQNIFYYRNKLEYTFSNRRWLLDDDMLLPIEQRNTLALGFHIPLLFDRILDIEQCWLQADPSNAIRLAVRNYALDHHLSFYDIRNHTGFLRNLVIRNTTTGDLMVILIVAERKEKELQDILQFISQKFPQITSLQYIINEKMNDSYNDLETVTYRGKDYIEEQMPNLEQGKPNLTFKIGPKSFYQTNSEQAYVLYKVAADFAGLQSNEVVYDLYTGTGTIANFVASKARKVVGIEYVPEAIEDAKENAANNQITHTVFYAGDMVDILTDEFVSENGQPDVIITDPPRAGMHEKVVKQILKIAPSKIVYISCNAATQARDIEMMKEEYEVVKIQPVDMFPHTHHVENVVLMLRKTL